jgi:hypothetical protein
MRPTDFIILLPQVLPLVVLLFNLHLPFFGLAASVPDITRQSFFLFISLKKIHANSGSSWQSTIMAMCKCQCQLSHLAFLSELENGTIIIVFIIFISLPYP